MIRRRRLAREEECPWLHVESRILTQPVIQYNNSQRVQQLTFVFVDAFDLAIENTVRVHYLAGIRAQPIGKLSLGRAFGLLKRVREGRVRSQWLQLTQLAQIGNPAIPNSRGNCTGE